MLINGFKNFNIGFNKVQNFAKPNAPKFNTGLQKDTFQKSNPSFGSKEYDEFDHWIEHDLENSLDEIREEYGEETADMVRKEIHTKLFIQMLLTDEAKSIMDNKNGDKITLRKIFLSNEDSISIDLRTAINVFEKNGICTLRDARKFINKYEKIPNADEVFELLTIEAINIYGALSDENKDGFAKYPEILLQLYKDVETGESLKPLDDTVTFLKDTKIDNTADFNKKFGHLKKYFGDFGDIADITDCINFLQLSYDDKINLIDSIFKNNNIKITEKQNPKKLYAKNLDIVDYLYYRNNGENIDRLNNIFEIATSRDKIKDSDVKKFEKFWGKIDTAESVIQFFEFLAENKITAQDFDGIFSKGIISDTNPLEVIKSKKQYTEEITNIGIKNPEKFYTEYKQPVCAICEPDSDNKENLELFNKILSSQNIKDAKQLLSFYNRVCGTNKKSLSEEEFREFFDLFKYLPEERLQTPKIGKTKHITLKELKEEKAIFKSVENEIKGLKDASEDDYFFGKTTLDIYKQHYHFIKNNKGKLASALPAYLNKDIGSAINSISRTKYIGNLSAHIKPMTNLSSFIESKGIKFDNTQDENQYIENCIKILDAFNAEDEKSKERKQYFIESDFLTKSRGRLGELIEKSEKMGNTAEVLSVIADKKISSISAMEEFFRLYNGTKTTSSSLFNYLKTQTPDKTLDKITADINELQTKIDAAKMPIKISGDNLGKIDFAKCQNGTVEDIIATLNSIYETQGNENFLSHMSVVKYKKKDNYTSWQIACELLKYLGKNYESYQNIARLILNIDTRRLTKDNIAKRNIDEYEIQSRLDKKFVDFVNSNDWLKLNEKEMANIPLHAKLRAIDRFVLSDADSIEELYENSSKERLKNLINTIYTDQPTDVKGVEGENKIIVNFEHNAKIIEVLFNPETGDMITVVPKRQQN